MPARAVPVDLAFAAAWVGSDGLYEGFRGAIWAVLAAHGIEG